MVIVNALKEAREATAPPPQRHHNSYTNTTANTVLIPLVVPSHNASITASVNTSCLRLQCGAQFCCSEPLMHTHAIVMTPDPPPRPTAAPPYPQKPHTSMTLPTTYSKQVMTLEL